MAEEEVDSFLEQFSTELSSTEINVSSSSHAALSAGNTEERITYEVMIDAPDEAVNATDCDNDTSTPNGLNLDSEPAAQTARTVIADLGKAPMSVSAAPETAGSTKEDDNFHETLCAVCEAGGSLLCCAGRCLRSFHLQCVGLQEAQLAGMKSFSCGDCQSGLQRCFLCKHFALESALRRCGVDHCGKFYHDSCCLSPPPSTTPPATDETAADMVELATVVTAAEGLDANEAVAGGTVDAVHAAHAEGAALQAVEVPPERTSSDWVCPLHTCAGCRERASSPALASAKRRSLVRCFRCPKAYHLRCRPRDLHNLALGVFLCIAHVSQQADLPPLPPELRAAAVAAATAARGGAAAVVVDKSDPRARAGPERPWRREEGAAAEAAEEDVQFTPGVIVRLDGLQPGTHVFAIKDALKEYGDVRFIEFDEAGATHAFARMGTPHSARFIVEVARSQRGLRIPFTRPGARVSAGSVRGPSYPSARVLEGAEELEHWRAVAARMGEAAGSRKRRAEDEDTLGARHHGAGGGSREQAHRTRPPLDASGAGRFSSSNPNRPRFDDDYARGSSSQPAVTLSRTAAALSGAMVGGGGGPAWADPYSRTGSLYDSGSGMGAGGHSPHHSQLFPRIDPYLNHGMTANNHYQQQQYNMGGGVYYSADGYRYNGFAGAGPPQFSAPPSYREAAYSGMPDDYLTYRGGMLPQQTGGYLPNSLAGGSRGNGYNLHNQQPYSNGSNFAPSNNDNNGSGLRYTNDSTSNKVDADLLFGMLASAGMLPSNPKN